LAPLAGAGLYAWALRAAQPNDGEARRRALEAASGAEDPGGVAVERFALEVGAGDRAAALNAIEDVGGEGAVAHALELARALITATGSPSQRPAAFDAMASRSGEAL